MNPLQYTECGCDPPLGSLCDRCKAERVCVHGVSLQHACTTCELKRLREALTLAEDVLSRAPFSTGIWPNGMHPNEGIGIIRAALKA